MTGDWLEAKARLLTEPDLIDAALVALREKYGWQMMATNFFSKLLRRYDNRVYIELSPRDT